MTTRDIAKIIEELAPLHVQESWDNAGFTVGSPNTEVKGALLCVDVTEAILDEAVEKGFNMIISHHPAIFHGLKTITGATHTERVVEKAIKNNLVLYAAHTNLDNVPEGVSWAMAKKLGLQNLQILSPEVGGAKGSGVVGNLPEAMPEKQWLELLKQTFSLPYLRHSEMPYKKVQRVAVCGGSGAFLIDEAVKAGAHSFVSAEFKYNHFFDALERILIVDVGHYESEKCVLSIFFDLLTKKMPNFAFQIADKIHNLVIYS